MYEALSGRVLPVGETHWELHKHGLHLSQERKSSSLLTGKISEEEVMRKQVAELKDRGIEASWQVGYATHITTPEWYVSVVNQEDIGRRIVTSYINPEALSQIGAGSLELGELAPHDINAIKKALSLPEFSGEQFKATRELLAYSHQVLPVLSSNPPSPATLCIQELKDRMAGINRPPHF